MRCGVPFVVFSAIVVLSLAGQSRAQVKQQLQTVGAAATAAQPRNLGFYVPAEVDPNNKTERVLIFLPGGPLIVETLLTIDGQPFQMAREQLLDEALKGVDADADGKVSWEEAIAKPGFLGARFVYLGQNKEQQQRAVAQYDQNKNGLVDRVELRMLYAQFTGGPALIVQNFGYGQQTPPVRELLDVNKDNLLDAEEIAAAPVRLKSRDANDNDIVDLVEMLGNPNAVYGGGQVNRGGMQPANSLLFYLHSQADWNALFDQLQKRYAKEGRLSADCFPLLPGLVKQLDKDENGALDKEELAGLLALEPQLSYEVNLGESGKLTTGGTLTMHFKQLAGPAIVVPGELTTLGFTTVRLQLAVSNPKPNYGNYDGYVTNLLNTYDKDKNGYLEKSETEGQQQIALQFTTWDLDGDGKVFADEIKKSFEKAQVPTWQRVTLSASEQGNSLFSLLDTDNNGRLGLREMRAAPERLRAADRNADGKITLDEIPGTIRFTVARGNGYGGGQFVQVGGGGVGRPAPGKSAGPDWFVRMDTNGDGDITPREFLGDAEQFKQLDANADGFIDAKEAAAVK